MILLLERIGVTGGCIFATPIVFIDRDAFYTIDNAFFYCPFIMSKNSRFIRASIFNSVSSDIGSSYPTAAGFLL